MVFEHSVYVLHARSLLHTGEDVVFVEGIGEDSVTLLECEAPARPNSITENSGVGTSRPTIDRALDRADLYDL